MSSEDGRSNTRHGIYRLWWRSGGSSLASVGSDCAGNHWYMPANWVTGPGKDWSIVQRFELLS